MLVAGLSGCQLIEAVRPLGAGQLPREGTCATYELVGTPTRPVTPESVDQARTIVQNRIDTTGVADVVLRIEEGNLLRLGIPELGPDGEAAQVIRDLVSAPGVLEFVPIPEEHFGQLEAGSPLPEGMADTEPLFGGEEIASASVSRDPAMDLITVNLELKETGARLFDEWAAEHYGDQFAIVLDGIVTSAPTINATHFGGQAQISGAFTATEAQELVSVMKFGSLPLEVREVEFGACETGSAAEPSSSSGDAMGLQGLCHQGGPPLESAVGHRGRKCAGGSPSVSSSEVPGQQQEEPADDHPPLLCAEARSVAPGRLRHPRRHGSPSRRP